MKLAKDKKIPILLFGESINKIKGYGLSLTLWTFTLIEKLEYELGIPLTKILEYWQILEYRTYQRLADLKFRFRYSHPYCDNLLKSYDFTIYFSKRSVIHVECKYINCSRVYNVKSFVQSVIKNNVKSDKSIYVVNQSFYSLLKETGMLRDNITTVKGLETSLRRLGKW